MFDGLSGLLQIRRNTSLEDLRYGGASTSGELVTDTSALALSAVWACVNLVSGTISSLPLMVYRTKADGSREIAKDHPLYRLLHDSPNYDQSALDFWDFIAASIELRGNGFAQIIRAGGRVISLSPINPAHMNVRRLPSGALQYSWSSHGKSYISSDRDILHIRGFGGDPVGGMSTLRFARNSFGLAMSAERSAGEMFRNGLRPSGVLKFKPWLTDPQRDIARKELADKIGTGNGGKPLILEGDTEWQQLTISPEDAQMIETRTFSVEEICRFFGVPPHMVGHTSKATSFGTGIESQTLGFQKFTLRRRFKRIEQALEKQLLTPADRAAGIVIEFNQEGLLRGDTKGRASFYQVMTAIGAMTINEVRRLENLPPVEGGDVPRIQMQNVPITETDNEMIGHNGGPPLED
ncbi:phage portal protein [Ochrobactrum sp. C6C9]|uniref:phage portal protein n=1 Tax=Ochrobactrum sp. C6C9 TaxID=2736662 RepID=UPI0035304969|nr:phage portal protein [Ochrobactrum sp. C6C9]